MRPREDRPFAQLIRDRTGVDFVERRWLRDSIQTALDTEPCRFVLVTGEPGVGKTSVLSGLARDNPRWLRYFVAQPDGGTHTPGDVTSFLLSIGHQFARQWPEAFDVTRLEIVVQQHIDRIDAVGSAVGIRISDLTVSPFHRTATLAVEQRAGRVMGSLAGVEIGTAHLEPRLLTPANLAHLALVAPAEVLLARDPSARIVILLDALDDAIRSGTGDGLLDWLATSGVLPPNVRAVVTSRPVSALAGLRTGRAGQLTEIGVDPADRRVGADLAAYAGIVLATPEIDRAVRARGALPDQFHRRVVEHASGNFQYLASYARALTDAIAEGAEELSARLLRLDSFPSGLSGIYAFFAEAARKDIERLGMLDIREPRGDADMATPAWEGTGEPILGVLTVAREPLTVEQLTRLSGVRVWPRAVRNVLSRLRWLLDVRGDRVAFFHQSVGDFLLSDQAVADCPDCAVDEAEWHERILRHYRGTARSWADVDWTRVDHYGLAHLADHLERAAPHDLVHLVCPGLSRAIRRTFGTDQRFLDLVDRSATQVARTGDVASALSDVVFLGVVRHQVSMAGNRLPPEVLGLLARRGRLREALDRTAAMRPSARQFASVLEIVRHARPGPDDPSVDELVELLVDTAVVLGGASTDGEGHHCDAGPWAAVKIAAQVLATRDIDRALRLWEHGKQTAGAQRDRDEWPDEMYRAAALVAADIGRACTLVGRMRENRAGGYLDLAERAGPERIGTVLTNAEACLGSLAPARRLRELARLAAAWTPHDPAKGATLLARLRSAAFEAVADEEFGKHVAEAAAALAAVDRETARMLLACLDTTVANGRSADGCIRAIELWTRWEEPDRAQALVRRLAAWHKDPGGWYGRRVRSAVDSATGTVDRAERIRLLEEIHARIPDAHEVRGYMETGDRDRSLAAVARELAHHDAARAAEIAREIAGDRWAETLSDRFSVDANGYPELDTFTIDRYTVLADIAHRCLDRDDEPGADRLLEEILRSTEDTATLGPARDDHAAFMRASDPDPEAVEGKARSYRMTPVNPIGEPKSFRRYALEGMMVTYNLSQDWSSRAKRYFYREPADLVRAVSFGPYTLARTVRVLAEHGRDHARATAAVRTIADPGERAIGLSGLHLAAHTPNHGPVAEVLSQELDRTLAHLETYRWTVEMDDQDSHAWAYVRPDHRVRFEVAVRALGCRPQDYAALDELPFLGRTMAWSLYLWICRNHHVPDMIAGRPLRPSYAQMHETLLAGEDGDPLSDIAQAQAACEDLRIRAARPGYRSAAPWGRISDPVYAAVLALAAPEPGAPLNPAFAAAVTKLTGQGGLPAAAGLVTFAAQTRPECAADLRGLGEKIVAATADSTPARRVDTLARLTGAPALAGLVDPAAVCDEAERCSPDNWEYWVPEDARARVFPALLTEAPAVALHKFYQAAATRWELAMRLLESAVDPLVAAFAGDPAPTLADGVCRGLAATSVDGRVPETVDGVCVEELARLDAHGGGRA